MAPSPSFAVVIRFVGNFAGTGGYMICYSLGFFVGKKAVAYAGDYNIELIPVDIVSSVVLAAGAAAAAEQKVLKALAELPPQQQQQEVKAEMKREVMIYHVTASATNPLSLPEAFKYLKMFFNANPPPFRLPFTK